MQLLFPSFLFGLITIFIPVIIHLLQLRRPQRVQFTNTEFIKRLELTVARQRRIKQWLVLLTRVLALVALVLAFCQPFIPAQSSADLVTGGTIHVVVDASPSMQVAGESNENLFQDAVQQAQRLARENGPQARLTLLNSGRSTLTSSAFQNKLLQLKLGEEGSGLQKALVAQPADGGPLYVFSDFQKNEVPTAFLSILKSTGEVVLIPERGKQAANVYVDSVWLDDAFVRVRTNVALHVRLRNGGQLDATDCPVKVFLGQQQLAAFRSTIAAGQVVTTVVQVQVADNALVLGRVVTEDAPIRFDNTFYFTLQPSAQIRIVEVGATPLVQQVYRNEPVFKYTYSQSETVNYAQLDAANLLVLRELPQIAPGLREALQRFVKRGGSVVIVPSADEKSHASYQQLFQGFGIGIPQWEPITKAPEWREVSMPSAQEPFFRDVFGARQRQVSMPRAAPVLRWTRTDTDILKFGDGDSYLASFKTEAGRVYVFSAPFTAAYSDFANHALFVPVLYRLAMLSYHNDQLPAYSLSQADLKLTVALADTKGEEAGLRLVKDSLTLIPEQRMQGSELRLTMPPGLSEPGFYQLQRQNRVITTLAFNQDKRESELAAYSAADLRKLLGTDYPNVRVLEGEADTAIARYRAEQTGQPLWRYCVLAVLLCLLAEAILLRTGHQKQAVAGSR
jgi:hypothetical protein